MNRQAGGLQLAFRGYLLFRATLVALTIFALAATTSHFAPAAEAVNGGGNILYVNQYSPNASSTPGCEPDADPYDEIGYEGNPADPAFPGSGAVNDADSGDTIFICGSPLADLTPYRPNPTVTTWDKDLTFIGDGPELTIIDGDGERTPFFANAAGSYLNFKSMTVRNGEDAVFGGSVEAPDRVVNVEDVKFINNQALGGDGGAIYADEVDVTDSHFIGNSASDGVAGAIAALGRITVHRSTFNDNSAETWGGALSAGAGVAITDSSFTDNAVTGSGGSVRGGGAVYAEGVPSTIESSTFSGNSVGSAGPSGGAIRVLGVALTVINTTFTGNNADEAPVISSSDNVTLQSVTMSANNGPRDINTGGQLAIGGSIIDETGETCAAVTRRNDEGNVIANTTADAGDCSPFVGGGGAPATKVDPLEIELQDLTDNGGPTETLALSFDSVARASLAANCPEFDQRGLPRPANDCSSGAYQLTTRQLTVTKAGGGSGTVTSSPTGIDCGPNCSDQSAQFIQNPPFTTVILTASAATGSTFTGWSGACSGNAPTCQVGLEGAREVTAGFVAESPPRSPKLKVSFSSPNKVKAGNRFSTRVTVANRAKSSNGSARVNGNSPTSATGLKSCLKLPATVIAIRAKGAKATGGRLCWSKAKLAAGKKVSYTARLRLTRSAGASRKARSATLRASVTASNTTGESFQASGKKAFRITPAKPRRPKPVTG